MSSSSHTQGAHRSATRRLDPRWATLETRHWQGKQRRTLEHLALLDKAIFAIVKQLKQHPLLQEIINPIVTAEYFRSSFQHVPEQAASSPIGRHVGHYKACLDPNDEHEILLAEVHAALMTIPLATVYCPERWRRAMDVMLEKIPGISKKNKLRIIQVLEADLKQVLRCAFVRNISKLANNTMSNS
jgi:hypothetical protein